jgi:hypothetical protein
MLLTAKSPSRRAQSVTGPAGRCGQDPRGVHELIFTAGVFAVHVRLSHPPAELGGVIDAFEAAWAFFGVGVGELE